MDPATKDAIGYEGGAYYVYALVDPIRYKATGSRLLSVFYVGKGRKDRAEEHEKEQIRALREEVSKLPMGGSKAERIRALLGHGERIPAIILCSGFTDEDAAYRAETLAMELIGRYLAAYEMPALTNATPGHGQSRGMAQEGLLSRMDDERPRRGSAAALPMQDDTQFLWVEKALALSTTRRIHWQAVLNEPTILVKGTREEMPSGTHKSLPLTALPPMLAPVAHRIELKSSSILSGSDFNRPAWNPDNPWSDHEARERAYRYWPIAKHRVLGWLEKPHTMPKTLLLAIPGSGSTTVRYAWEVDSSGSWEFYPDRGRWGVPLGARLNDHASLGAALMERRTGQDGLEREVQVLAGYSSGVRVFES